MTGNTIADIWCRLIQPDGAPLDRAAAEFLISLRFPTTDQQRIAELSEKAQAGNLSSDERAELTAYIGVANTLAVLQSKARVAQMPCERSE